MSLQCAANQQSYIISYRRLLKSSPFLANYAYYELALSNKPRTSL